MIPLDGYQTTDSAYESHPYRTKVGRANHYIDPLPTCQIAEATDRTWPAVSTVKNASASDWTAVAIKRIAPVIVANPEHFKGLDVDAVKAEMRRIDKTSLMQAATRGTNVHLMAEEHLTGQGVMIADDAPGAEYRATVDAFFDHYQPESVLTEFVCINRDLNEHGYGGTADGVIRIDGKLYLVDWKSRGDDSRHGAYPQEAAQLGAYAQADYIIVGDKRQSLPELDGGLIVSIKPDGFAVYPIDLEHACRHWRDLHAWWAARKDERTAIGRMWPKPKIAAPPTPSGVEQRGGGDATHGSETSPPPTLDELRAQVRDEFTADDRASLVAYFERHEVDTADAEQVAEAIAAIRSFHDVQVAPAVRPVTPPAAPVVQLPTNPDEGPDVDDEGTHAALKARYEALDAAGQSWIAEITKQAAAAGTPISMGAQSGRRTVRRWEILRGLVALADGFDNDDALRGCIGAAIGYELADSTTFNHGQLVGCMDAFEAGQFAKYATWLVEGMASMNFDDNGRCRVAA